MSWWQTANRWVGLVMFGVPALMSVPAVVATAARFGVWATVSAAAVPVVVICLPLGTWIWYLRRPPRSRRARTGWGVAASVAVTLLGVTPIRWWTAPVLLVLLSETFRLLAATRRRSTGAGRPRKAST
jgi:hypothetical protein